MKNRMLVLMKAEFLADDRNNEIGVPGRQELVLRLGALEVALAGQAARADGDLGLDDVVAGRGFVFGGIQEGNDAVLLVRLQNGMPADDAAKNTSRNDTTSTAGLIFFNRITSGMKAQRMKETPMSGWRMIKATGTSDDRHHFDEGLPVDHFELGQYLGQVTGPGGP